MFLLGPGVNYHIVQVYQGVPEVQSPKQFCMRRWNIAGALHNP